MKARYIVPTCVQRNGIIRAFMAFNTFELAVKYLKEMKENGVPCVIKITSLVLPEKEAEKCIGLLLQTDITLELMKKLCDHGYTTVINDGNVTFTCS